MQAATQALHHYLNCLWQDLFCQWLKWILKNFNWRKKAGEIVGCIDEALQNGANILPVVLNGELIYDGAVEK